MIILFAIIFTILFWTTIATQCQIFTFIKVIQQYACKTKKISTLRLWNVLIHLILLFYRYDRVSLQQRCLKTCQSFCAAVMLSREWPTVPPPDGQ